MGKKGQIKRHVTIDDLNKMPNLICGYASVRGDNSMHGNRTLKQDNYYIIKGRKYTNEENS